MLHIQLWVTIAMHGMDRSHLAYIRKAFGKGLLLHITTLLHSLPRHLFNTHIVAVTRAYFLKIFHGNNFHVFNFCGTRVPTKIIFIVHTLLHWVLLKSCDHINLYSNKSNLVTGVKICNCHMICETIHSQNIYGLLYDSQ